MLKCVFFFLQELETIQPVGGPASQSALVSIISKGHLELVSDEIIQVCWVLGLGVRV